MLDLALAIPRVVIGLFFVGHGAQKLFGWFGGHGLSGTSGYFASLGIRPAKPLALLVGIAELAGGLGLTLGLATPIAAATITTVMLGAIAFAHWPRVWVAEGGFEYPVVAMSVAALFGLVGPGAHALDRVLGIAMPMPETYVAGLLVGIVLVLGALALRDAQARQAASAARAA